MYQPGSHWTDFREFLYLGHLRKSVERLQSWLKLDDKIAHFNADLSTFLFLTAVLRISVLALPWQHSTVLYY
jgi:hypothetical protein